ncbi:MAG TPA: exo-beta-N-acetylmuramidase NamZ domain-containing protein [Blastocatellia bacterium]|nr:exo-beta-N-acetylmuramidase NamZ domain-containing protein [Blastocatellia bacterium]
MARLFLSWALLFSIAFGQAPASLPAASPSSVGMSPVQLAYIDQAVESEIAKKQLPGAVVLVGRQGKVVWRRAYGNRALEPAPEPMAVDTIFDLASLTKVVATATSVMILVERGQVRLGDPVARYIPEFADAGKKNITVEQLLTHRSGFMPDNRIEDYQQGPEQAFANIWKLAPIAETASKFIYSDVNYIVLGELVRRVGGRPLDEFAAENIFRPLAMKDTGFRPAAGLQPRIAPTEKRGGKSLVAGTGEKTEAGEDHWMRGEVHDPRSYLLGGVAGHAGLFSTADDLAIYCQMILNGGEYQGVRILSQMGVARMTEARPTGGNATDGSARGIGWDIFTSYSANRGDLFPVGSFGHTGFTGTGLWIDPANQTFVVFLSNRVHPKLDPKQPADVTSLRGRVASIVAASILNPSLRPPDSAYQAFTAKTSSGEMGFGLSAAKTSSPPSLNGIDVLVRDNFSPLKGRRVGLITNHTGRDREGRSTIDLLKAAPDVTLVALFSPEHGIRGVMDEKVANSTDEKTGLPIYSLYGETRQPTAEMLKGIDTLVFDIQDVGARFYTYSSTLGLAMEAAAKNNIRFVVLDRVNPINGVDVEGPIADSDKLSFVAYHRVPVRHGMTLGEVARLYNAERAINADLHVVQVENWKRDEWFDETGLVWVNPSPNMRSLTEATLYPGVCLLEPTNVSVGRGTDTPFELVGAPWIDGRKLAEALNNTKLVGVRFVPVRFTPKASVHKDAECGGVNIIVTNRAQFEPVITGLEIAAQLLKLYPKDFATDKFNRLLVNQKVYDAFKLGAEAKAMKQVWEGELDGFKAIRRRYLLY